jgi:Holliday junction DNA helicase RuvB
MTTEFNDSELTILTVNDNILRPSSWDEYVGNESMIEQIKVSIAAAKQRQEAMHHILLSGLSGGGKTTAARIIASEMGGESKIVSAPGIKSIADIVSLVVSLKPMSVLFIDEIHALRRDIEEHLYHAMEDGCIDIKIKATQQLIASKQTKEKIQTIKLEPFTLVAATTRPGSISGPMRNRFPLAFTLEPYSDEEIARVILQSVDRMKLKVEDKQAVSSIAVRSRGTPRVANNMLLVVRDYAQMYNGNAINNDCVLKTMTLCGIDDDGLSRIDRKYLYILRRIYQGGPVGVRAMAANMVDEDVKTLEEVVEPWLMRKGFIARTTRGRVLTELGWTRCESIVDSFGQKEETKETKEKTNEKPSGH